MSSIKVLYVGLFGVLGVYARYFAGFLIEKHSVPQLPLATFLINLLGSFLIGFVYIFGVERVLLSAEVRLGLMVGFLGGFTTFSSFCLETALLIERGQMVLGMIYFMVSPLLGLVGAIVGVVLARRLIGG